MDCTRDFKWFSFYRDSSFIQNFILKVLNSDHFYLSLHVNNLQVTLPKTAIEEKKFNKEKQGYLHQFNLDIGYQDTGVNRTYQS